MVTKSLDKSAGVLAVLWTVGGYAFLRYGVAGHRQFFRSIEPALPLILLVWFGVSVLLVIAGLRRGNTLGRICSVCTIAVLFCLAEPFHGVGRKVGNLFRKDEYAHIYYGAPECQVMASIRTDQEVAVFNDSVEQFAKQHGIRECRQKRYTAYSGPPRPRYKGEHVAIWSGVSWTTNASQKTGGVRLAPYDEAYPVDDFKRLADSLASVMRSAFPDRVEVTFREAEKQ